MKILQCRKIVIMIKIIQVTQKMDLHHNKTEAKSNTSHIPTQSKKKERACAT